MCFYPMALSLREIVAVLEILGVNPSHGAVWNWTHKLAEAQSDPPTATPSRVAVDETQIEVDGEKKRLYAAIDMDSTLRWRSASIAITRTQSVLGCAVGVSTWLK